ncbi:MAG: hypothetical protein AAFV29_00565 [Myxococcota bacterium]
MASLVVTQNARPEMVTPPPYSAKSPPQATLAAWTEVVSIMDQRAARIGVNVDQQRAQHEFLVGPAREQARDCGRDIDCLAEIGAALDADIVVVGVLAQRMALLAVRVDDRRVLAKARSPKGGTAVQRARKAAQRLSRRLAKALRTPATPLAKAQTRKPIAPQAALSQEIQPPAPPTERPAEELPIVAPPSLAASQPSAQTPPSAPADGMLYIHREQLVGVTALTLDGEPVSFTGKGFVASPVPGGLHKLRAVHIDGRTLEKTVVIQSGQTTNFDLRFAPTTAVAAADAFDANALPSDTVTQKWWFWTAVGTAVLAGATTAALLASGGKGGPTPPTESGSIQGSY